MLAVFVANVEAQRARLDPLRKVHAITNFVVVSAVHVSFVLALSKISDRFCFGDTAACLPSPSLSGVLAELEEITTPLKHTIWLCSAGHAISSAFLNRPLSNAAKAAALIDQELEVVSTESVLLNADIVSAMTAMAFGITVLPTSTERFCSTPTAAQVSQANWHRIPVTGLFVASAVGLVATVSEVHNLDLHPASWTTIHHQWTVTIHHFISLHVGVLEIAGVAAFIGFNHHLKATACECGTDCDAEDWLAFGDSAKVSMWWETTSLECLISGLQARVSWDLMSAFVLTVHDIGPVWGFCFPILLQLLQLVAHWLVNPGFLFTGLEGLAQDACDVCAAP